MSSLILSGVTILCACDSIATDQDGRLIAMLDGKPDGIYPADMSAVQNVTLPSDWPGHGYTYADGVFTPLPAPAPPVPYSISDIQFRLALNASGLRTDAENYIAAASQDVKDWWDRALTFEIDNPMLLAAVAGLNKTADDLAGLFRLAATKG